MTQQPLTAEKKHSPAVPTVYEVFYKRTIPFVTLTLDHSGKNVAVESTEDNLYIKIPQSPMSSAVQCRGIDHGCVTGLAFLGIGGAELQAKSQKFHFQRTGCHIPCI